MASEHRSADATTYTMDYRQPHRELEPAAQEIAAVDGALGALRNAGLLPHTRYDHARFLAHREAVRKHFEIPWTAITPRMQRLLYAISAITRPADLLAAGIFCGNTFISTAGAGAGPGACYPARRLIGVEIKPDEATRAERNVRRIDPSGVARVITADAVTVARDWEGRIDLLYLDANDNGNRGKGIYLDILEAAWDKLPAGALVLAHNSFNLADKLKSYLDHVRSPIHTRASVNVIIDGEGLEVSQR